MRRKIGCFALAVLLSWAICLQFEISAASAVFFACFALIYPVLGRVAPGEGRYLPLAAFFGFARVLGRSFDRHDSWVEVAKDLPTALRALAAMAALSLLAFSAMVLVHRALQEARRSVPMAAGEGRRLFVQTALILFAGSLPYLLLYWPGLNIADTRDQLLQFYGYPSVLGDGSALTDHHPALTTFLYAGSIGLGRMLGSANLGQALYSLGSLLAVSLSMAHLLTTLRGLGLSAGCCRGIAALFALWPVPALYAFNMCKDVSVAPVLLLYCAELLRLFARGGSRGRFLRLFALLLALMFLRKTAVYAALFALPVFLWLARRGRRGMAMATGAALLAFALGTLGLRLSGVRPGEGREMFSVPLQMVARTLAAGQELTPQERADLSRVMDLSRAGADYLPRLADPVKDRTNPEAGAADWLAFLRGWARLGLRDPGAYLAAWMNQAYGFFYPSPGDTIVCLTLNSPEQPGLVLSQNPALAPARLELHNVIYFRLRQIPALGALFYVDFLVWAFLFLLVHLGTRRAAAPWGFFLGTLLLALLSPKSGEVRYVLPLLYALPAMLGLALIDPEDAS